ncbi:MAG: nucleotidyl transferase AbiEii/AbiGii toxin family protein [Rhabdochlamydiaceae bacterium]|nr:nucleotidyl transferase AbiEii/AbiGii toxin family protein [Candidatus Amphrikana amoebophyrae]
MINQQSLKARLQTIAKLKSVPFNACWKQLILERFLSRLARSTYVDKLIFKGGFLLSYLIKIGRETIDIDFLLTKIKAEESILQKICTEISAINSGDGFTFTFSKIDILSQPHMDYPGYRIILDVSFDKMKDRIHIDIGIGDEVPPEQIELETFQYKNKPFFDDAISLYVYPIEYIYHLCRKTPSFRSGM